MEPVIHMCRAQVLVNPYPGMNVSPAEAVWGASAPPACCFSTSHQPPGSVLKLEVYFYQLSSQSCSYRCTPQNNKCKKDAKIDFFFLTSCFILHLKGIDSSLQRPTRAGRRGRPFSSFVTTTDFRNSPGNILNNREFFGCVAAKKCDVTQD